MEVIHVSEGLRMLRRRIRVWQHGFHGYHGNATAICKAVIHDCYNAHHEYYQTSTGNYCEFWTRDFAWCVSPLIRLGHAREVVHTIEYALGIFARHQKVTTTINPQGKPFDFPFYAADSLPLLLYSLVEAKRLITDPAIARQVEEVIFAYKPLLEEQVGVFCDLVIGPKGLVKHAHFSSMKDHAMRSQSCYDQTMIALLDQSVKLLGLKAHLPAHDYKAVLIEHFWKDDHFIDRIGSSVVSGDANVVPFWTGVIRDGHMVRKAIERVEHEGLCIQVPMRYMKSREEHHAVWQAIFAPNYEGDTSWAHLGMMYLEVLSRYDSLRAKVVLNQYAKKIEQYKTFIELYEKNGTPYHSWLYMADEGMLWCANWLDVATRLRGM